MDSGHVCRVTRWREKENQGWLLGVVFEETQKLVPFAEMREIQGRKGFEELPSIVQ